MIELAFVLDGEADGLVLADLEVVGREDHLAIRRLFHADADGLGDFRGVAGFADGHDLAVSAGVVAGRQSGGRKCCQHKAKNCSVHVVFLFVWED
ncbi:hypothetical protein D3C80_1386360 [compost metagenome]